jgi:Ras-related GTP-binding protein C/D
MSEQYSVIPMPSNWPKVPPGQDRLIFSDSSVLHGKPIQIKTRAQLKLEHVLQDIQRIKQANQAAQLKAANPNENKFRDSKPRLLLMGLRRYVCRLL